MKTEKFIIDCEFSFENLTKFLQICEKVDITNKIVSVKAKRIGYFNHFYTIVKTKKLKENESEYLHTLISREKIKIL